MAEFMLFNLKPRWEVTFVRIGGGFEVNKWSVRNSFYHGTHFGTRNGVPPPVTINNPST